VDFSFKNSDGKLQSLKFNMGDSWVEKAQDNKVLNSIFSRVDDGDGVVEENEVNLLKKLLEKADGLIKNLAGDKEISNEELQELDKQLEKKKMNLADVEFEVIQKINKDDYSFEAIKQRYPEDKFEIRQDYSAISVINKANGKEILRVIEDKGEIYITENDDNGKEKLFRNFDKDGELRFYDKDSVRHNPIADMIYKSVSARTTLGLGTTSVDFLGNIMKISPKNALDVAKYYRECYGQSLEDAINQEWGLDENIKKQALEHFEKCLSAAYGFDENYSNENSKVENKYYQGKSYSVKQEGNVIAIKNNASEKEYQLDLEELIKNFPLEDKAKLRAIIQQLPGEVLADIAVELDSSFTNADETFSSVHVVNILRKVCGVCNAEACYSVRTNSVDTTARESTIVHELGHAVDYNGIDKNISSIINNEEFNNIFKEEMNAYLAAGHTRYNSKVGDFDNCYFREGGGRYSSKYATYDEQEMFAECYAMLMTGECKSRDLIEDFFPKTLQVIAKHIEYVRSLPDDVRCASRN